jgi:hypothetical protein
MDLKVVCVCGGGFLVASVALGWITGLHLEAAFMMVMAALTAAKELLHDNHSRP